MRPKTRIEARKRRHLRLRQKVCGTAARPRMSVRFTNKNIHVQFIDDLTGRTLAAVSTVTKAGARVKPNLAGAKQVGAQAARSAQAKNITTVVFDRGGLKFHGRVKALADAAREAGLKF